MKSEDSATSDPRSYYAGICDVYRVIAEEHDLADDARAIARRRREWWMKQVQYLDQPSVAESLRRRAHRAQTPGHGAQGLVDTGSAGGGTNAP